MAYKKGTKKTNHHDFLRTGADKTLVALNAVVAVLFFVILAFFFERDSLIMYWVLILGAAFFLWQALTFLYTVWNTDYRHKRDDSFRPWVDVFITVAGEPLDIIEETVRAAKSMRYPNFRIYILNDGYVAKKSNWRDVRLLAKKLKVGCITRDKPGGAKAGNINNALRRTKSPFVVIFDADHVPHEDFLEKTAGYFKDPKVGFVQSPQYYKNQEDNGVTSGAWGQQSLFFGAICKGKNRMNSVTMCGTNMMVRRSVLEEVGGMCEYSIAEDFLTGLFIHQRGYKSVCVPEVLAEGLAPEDFLSYYKQQFRWARGSMDVLFRHNIFSRTKLTIKQKIQYLSSVSYFLTGFVVLANALIPIVFFFTGLTPFKISTMELALVFLPYIFLILYTLQRSCNFSYTWKALAFSMASFPIHIQAFFASLFRLNSSFSVTSKKQLTGNFLHLTIPHIFYLVLIIVGLSVAVARQGVDPSVMTNLSWALVNAFVFSEFIIAAAPRQVPFAFFQKPSEVHAAVEIKGGGGSGISRSNNSKIWSEQRTKI